MPGKYSKGLFAAHRRSFERLILGDDLRHPLLDELQIIGVEWLGNLEVVVEAVGNGRADGKGGSFEQVEDRLSHHVGGRVAQNVKTLVAVEGYHREITILCDRPRQVEKIAVDLDRYRGAGQPGADRLGNLEPGHTVPVRNNLPVGITKIYWHVTFWLAWAAE